MAPRTYVVYIYPGLLFNNEEVRLVKTRDVAKVKMPKNAFAFYFFSAVNRNAPQRNISTLYYYGGRIYTLADVKKEMPKEKILISNMESHGWKKVIKTRCGNFQPFERGHVLITPQRPPP